ncbi:MAG: hypothetical protein ABI878_06445 [Acidobacteriota bacterium]
MSFDLYFYKKKGSAVSEKEIAAFLTSNGCVREGEFPQWFYANDATGVYFSFEIQAESDDPEEITRFESFDEFDNTRFSFNINFIRPNFFALEAFPIVERLMSKFDLSALDPQFDEDPDNPRKRTAEEYYQEWSIPNLKLCSERFDQFGLLHFPMEKSNDYWRYNLSVRELQNKLGDDCFVPRLFLAKRVETGEPITLSTWNQHIPTILPPADFFAISREKKKLFRTIKESGVISGPKLLETFEGYLGKYEVKDCHIISSENSERVADAFNNVRFDYAFEGFSEPIDSQHLTNAERSPNQISD